MICAFRRSGQTLLNQRLLPSVAHSWNQLHLLVFTSPYMIWVETEGEIKKRNFQYRSINIGGGDSYLIIIFVAFSVIEQLTDKEQVWEKCIL